MKSIRDFIKSHFYAITWTACYVCIMWAILTWLFNFNMFSIAAWTKLASSHLHGFGGFVFGILILAAIPMYIATTTVIMRNKKFLFSISMPNIIKRAFVPPPPTPAPAPVPPAQPEPPAPETKPAVEPPLPPEMPTELRQAFIRIRRGDSIRHAISAFDVSAVTKPEPAPADDMRTIEENASDFPLPTDFDTDGASDFATPLSAMPEFTEISFDTTDDKPVPEQPATGKDSETPPPPQQTSTNNDLIGTLVAMGRNANTDGEFIISDDVIIAAHVDTDFWIADDETWFATGRTCPSPVAAVRARAAELNLSPVLYLGATHIMDLEERIAAWESDGVRVITDLGALAD